MRRGRTIAPLAPEQRAVLALLLGVQAAAIAPLFGGLPPWVPATALALVGLRALALWRGRPMPPGWVLGLLGAGGAIAIFVQFHSLNGREAGISMLLFASVLKGYEVRTRRDLVLLVYLGYLLALAHFLFDQSIPWVLYAFVLVLVVTAALARLHAGPRPPGWRKLGLGGLLRMLVAIPLTVLLFALFPRIEGPLWGRPAQDQNAVTGLADSLDPGGIAQLAQSQAVAFRATFGGAPPPHDARYWRVYVMDHFDGRRWVPVPNAGQKMGVLEARGPLLHYSLLMQASGSRAVPALDMPARAPTRVRLTTGHTLRAEQPVDSTSEYALSAATDYTLDPTLSPNARAAALQLPPGTALRARQLAASWRAADPKPQAIIGRALAYIHTQPFYYTLQPPPLHGDITDDFLFNVRSGFCEQYASAFAVLMRAADIPTRVVAGYAGGEWNPVLHYLLVRQANAHAWIEVWLSGRGWVRVDPTSAIAVNRVQQDVATGPATAGVASGQRIGFMQRWLSNLSMGWDSVEYFWNISIVAFGPQQQRAFLRSIGLHADGIHQVLYIVVGMASLMLLWLGIDLLRRSLPKADAATRLYRRYLRRLGRSGLRPATSEGALDFAERVAERWPHEAARARRIAALYVEARFARGDQRQQEQRLHRLARALRGDRRGT